MPDAIPPYKFNAGCWADERCFVGRVDLLRTARELLREPEAYQGRWYLGRRRQGKTSLLQAIAREATSQPDPPIWTRVFVDLGAHRTEAEVARAIVRGLRAALPVGPVFTARHDGRSPLGELLLNLEEHTRSWPLRVALLLDEGDALMTTDEELEAMPSLRGQAGAICRGLLSWVNGAPFPFRIFLASTRRLRSLDDPNACELLQQLPSTWLGNLEPPAVRDMLDRASLAPTIRAGLEADCGGHPFLLHACGHAQQSPQVDVGSQLGRCFEHDFIHVSREEARWMESLARGERMPSPSTVRELELLSYVRAGPSGHVLVEGLLSAWLRSQSQRVVELAHLPPGPVNNAPTPPDTPAHGEPEGGELRLVRSAKPGARRHGNLQVSWADPEPLGGQEYLLLWMVAANRERGEKVLLHEADLVYPLRLGMAWLGYGHGVLAPRRVYSEIRKAIQLRSKGARRWDTWLPGVGGYRVSEPIIIARVDDPFDHLPEPRPDLLRAYRRWATGRRRFHEFLQAAHEGTTAQARKRRLALVYGPIVPSPFPQHEHLLVLRVEEPDGSPHVELGPIPLTAEEVTALQYWRYTSLEGDRGEDQITREGFERWRREHNRPAGDVRSPITLMTELGLRGGVRTAPGRASPGWLPEPGDHRPFALPPQWMDIGFEERTFEPGTCLSAADRPGDAG